MKVSQCIWSFLCVYNVLYASLLIHVLIVTIVQM